jgi:hypothetical protein
MSGMRVYSLKCTNTSISEACDYSTEQQWRSSLTPPLGDGSCSLEVESDKLTDISIWSSAGKQPEVPFHGFCEVIQAYVSAVGCGDVRGDCGVSCLLQGGEVS